MQALQKETIRLDGRYYRDFYKLWNSIFNIFAKDTSTKDENANEICYGQQAGRLCEPRDGFIKLEETEDS